MARSVLERKGGSGQGSHGEYWHGAERLFMVGQSRLGLVRHGLSWIGWDRLRLAVTARLRRSCKGQLGHGMAVADS